MQIILKPVILVTLITCSTTVTAVTEQNSIATNRIISTTNSPQTVEPATGSMPPCSTAKTTESVEKHSHLYNIGRGITNIATCWLEVPRCMVYRNSQVPFWGFVAGSIEGVGTTAMRAFAGITDVLFLGYDYGLMYDNQFGDFIWDARWQPKSDDSL